MDCFQCGARIVVSMEMVLKHISEMRKQNSRHSHRATRDVPKWQMYESKCWTNIGRHMVPMKAVIQVQRITLHKKATDCKHSSQGNLTRHLCVRGLGLSVCCRVLLYLSG